MRKQELIHIHALMVVIRCHLDDHADIDIPANAFAAYDDYGIKPTAIGERKDAHKTAVEYLSTGMYEALTSQQRTADLS